jgi:hypothetical protein
MEFGAVPPPPGISRFGGGTVVGIPLLLNVVIQSLIMVAAIYAVFNLVMAGYWYMSAAGDSKRIAEASAKIWQTVIGLIVAAGSVMIAGLIGQIFFGSPDAILNVKIFTP